MKFIYITEAIQKGISSINMKIYYSTAVRNTNQQTDIKNHIKILKAFGNVLTEHLGANNTDMNKTDKEIYQMDMELLLDCDIFIADVTNPSLGVGFMISKAIQLKKPVLCLYNMLIISKISAMINGCPNVMVISYVDDNSYRLMVTEFILKNHFPLRIIFCGSPGSGKSTVAKYIAERYNMPHISTGAILRGLHPKNQMYNIVRSYMNKGLLVPADIMREIVVNRLHELDVVKRGFILDGYPPSFADLQNLKEASIIPDFVFYFSCSDEVAIKRQCGRGRE